MLFIMILLDYPFYYQHHLIIVLNRTFVKKIITQTIISCTIRRERLKKINCLYIVKDLQLSEIIVTIKKPFLLLNTITKK